MTQHAVCHASPLYSWLIQYCSVTPCVSRCLRDLVKLGSPMIGVVASFETKVIIAYWCKGPWLLPTDCLKTLLEEDSIFVILHKFFDNFMKQNTVNLEWYKRLCVIWCFIISNYILFEAVIQTEAYRYSHTTSSVWGCPHDVWCKLRIEEAHNFVLFFFKYISIKLWLSHTVLSNCNVNPEVMDAPVSMMLEHPYLQG